MLLLKVVTTLIVVSLTPFVVIRDWRYHDRRTTKHHFATRIILILWIVGCLGSLILTWNETYLSGQLSRQIEQLAKDEEEWRRVDSAQSAFVTKKDASELLGRFPLGCQLFTMVQTPNGPYAVLTDSKTILPPDKAGKLGYLDFNWMQQGRASVGDQMVVLRLPVVILEGKLLPLFGNNILLRRATGVSVTMDTNPNGSNVFMRGNDVSSVSPDTRLLLSKDPTLSVVVEIRAVIEEGVVMVLGLTPYAKPAQQKN
jgi:hypothetical protein